MGTNDATISPPIIPIDLKLSIVLPYYNPPTGWEQHILEAYSAISDKLNSNIELIIVNDGSKLPISKDAISLIKRTIPNLKFFEYKPNKGKGAALRYGISKSSGEQIIFTDIDFPYTVVSFLKIWDKLKQYDIVIGVKDETYFQKVPPARIFISKLLQKLIGLIFKIPITDTQCGLKGFNKRGKAIFLKTSITRYLCDLEFIYLSFQQRPKLTITKQEVSLRPDVKFSKMNSKILFTETLNLFSIAFGKK